LKTASNEKNVSWTNRSFSCLYKIIACYVTVINSSTSKVNNISVNSDYFTSKDNNTSVNPHYFLLSSIICNQQIYKELCLYSC